VHLDPASPVAREDARSAAPAPPSKKPRFRSATLVVFCLLFLGYSAWLKHALLQDKSPLENLPIGGVMPDFTLNDTHGQAVKLSTLLRQNKTVLIDFWASWCGPCRIEMPMLEKLAKDDQSRGLVILAVNEDTEPDKRDAYLAAKPLTFPILLDNGRAFAEKTGIKAYPTTIVVRSDGTILSVGEGLDQFLQFKVEAALRAKPTAKGKKAPETVPSQ
jgi:cytochrome c biogenesis protein CcmG, thiol:disulfide interchange protein DsbE